MGDPINGDKMEADAKLYGATYEFTGNMHRLHGTAERVALTLFRAGFMFDDVTNCVYYGNKLVGSCIFNKPGAASLGYFYSHHIEVKKNRPLKAGTKVSITTWNGGAGVYELTAPYHDGLDCHLKTDYGHEFIVEAHRMQSIAKVR